MKKTFKTIAFLTILFVVTFSLSVFAQTNEDLDSLNITLDKTTVNPDGEVKVMVDFGTPLGSFDMDIDFDDALFEYVSTSEGTGVVTGDKLAVSFYDTTDPATTVSVTFKAKTGLTTSNPTQFLVTLKGMANSDDTIRYNEITTPIVKDVIVEPAYDNYSISIEYTEPIEKDTEHPIDVRIAATMGRSYDHLRLIAEATTPEDSTFQLLGTDSADLEHDVIDSGWGDAAGFGLGGAVDEVYHFRGVFSEDGEYTLTLKLIDRDDSDAVIATMTENITVGEAVPEAEETPDEEETVLPKTGVNIYIYLGTIAVATISAYAIINKKHS